MDCNFFLRPPSFLYICFRAPPSPSPPSPTLTFPRTLLTRKKPNVPFYYYMEKSVLLGTKPLVDSIRHFIWDPSGVFSVCHLCECRIVQRSHDSRLLLLLNWFLHIIKEHYTLARRYEFYVRSLVRYCSCHSNIKFISSRHRVISSIYPSIHPSVRPSVCLSLCLSVCLSGWLAV